MHGTRRAVQYRAGDGEGGLRGDERDGGLLVGGVDGLAADGAQVGKHHLMRTVLHHRHGRSVPAVSTYLFTPFYT